MRRCHKKRIDQLQTSTQTAEDKHNRQILAICTHDKSTGTELDGPVETLRKALKMPGFGVKWLAGAIKQKMIAYSSRRYVIKCYVSVQRLLRGARCDVGLPNISTSMGTKCPHWLALMAAILKENNQCELIQILLYRSNIDLIRLDTDRKTTFISSEGSRHTTRFYLSQWRASWWRPVFE